MVTRGIDLLGVKDAAEPLGTWLMVCVVIKGRQGPGKELTFEF
jgi:hypothetical protein